MSSPAGQRPRSAGTMPGRDELPSLVAAARAVLDSEPEALRPRDSAGRPGGLLVLPELPTVIAPDLHARPRFIEALLDWSPPGRSASLASLLSAGEASLVCLGDLFHSEAGGARERWARAYDEYVSGWERREAMDQEMSLALRTTRDVLEAKASYPRFFHYLKGNHDNISDEEGHGDHSFYKFAVEGEMTASWFVATYGGALLASYRAFELSLPVLALGKRFVASHGEPAFALSRTDIVESRSRPEVVEALIWTPNDGAHEGSVKRTIEALFGPALAPGALWFAGHRPVGGRYALRAGGRFVQFHDPTESRVAFLEPGRDPDPDRDIYDIPL
jgi:hypothetical protein